MKGLYIHIPFCVKKCDYCSFISFPHMEDCHEEYINAVIREMHQYRGEEIDTVFVGGGTPSAISAELISRLCNAVKTNFKLTEDYEWTIEVNPGTLDDEKIRAMLNGGINRVSVGVQSFNDNELQAIGRIHTAECAYNNICKLRKMGFENISLDLMESIPYQTEKSFVKSLETAMELPVSHISVYSLIIEDGTPLKRKYDEGVYEYPDEDDDRDWYEITQQYLNQFGFCRYEISNYALKGFESRHNMKYWQCDEYIGIGVAAHSFVNGRRYSDTENLRSYIQGDYRSGDCEALTETDLISEFMIMGLRMVKGVSKAEFQKRFGCTIESIYSREISKFTDVGLMEQTEEYLRLTRQGIDVSNSVMCEFVL